MTKERQKALVQSMADSLTKPLLHAIDAGKIPENWGAPEFRQFFQDHFVRIRGSMKIARFRNYLKDCINFK